LRGGLIGLRGQRDFHFEFSEEEKGDADLAFERVLLELKRRAEAANPQRVLIILDNVDQPELFAPALLGKLPAADWLHIIATTRLSSSELSRHLSFMEVGELQETDALTLIEKWQPQGIFSSQEECLAALEIARLLGCFPLAVETAAAYLGQYPEITCQAFRDRLKKKGFVAFDNATDRSLAVFHDKRCLSATLQPTLDRLSEPAKRVLEYAALLPADFVVLPWIRHGLAPDFPDLVEDAEPGYPDPWKNLVNKLILLRLLTRNSVEAQLVRMHRLVQELVRQLQTEEQIKARSNQLGIHAKGRSDEICKRWFATEIRWEIEPLVALADRWMKTPDQSETGAYIAANVADVLKDFARFNEAEALYREALAIYEQQYGANDDQVARCLNKLAGLLRENNRLQESEPYSRRALAISEHNHGPEHPDVATSLNHLAGVWYRLNRLAEAESAYRRALAIRELKLGPHDPLVARSLHNLAGLLYFINRAAEAELLGQRALEIRERCLGKDHPDVGWSLNLLAMLLDDKDRSTEAEPMYRRALQIQEKSFGTNHPDVAWTLNNLVVVLLKTDRLEEAEQVCRRGLAIREQSYGLNHPHVAWSLNNLGTVLAKTNRPDKAEPLFRRALETYERSLGVNHPHVGVSLIFLGEFLLEASKLDEALPVLERSFKIMSTFHRETGYFHAKHQRCVTSYGSLLGKLNWPEEQIQATLANEPS
jgi:tetratricopeptide (TPR) repeat protein